MYHPPTARPKAVCAVSGGSEASRGGAVMEKKPRGDRHKLMAADATCLDGRSVETKIPW